MERNMDNAIVVGVDGSEPSKRALQWAAEEAVRRGARLDVVHAWTVPFSLIPNGFADPKSYEAVAAAALDEAVASLGDTKLAALDIERVLVDGPAADCLLQASAGGELLVVGSRGHGGFVGLLMGSVSQRVVAHATCPVVVVPPTWKADWNRRIVVGIDGSGASYRALQWTVAEAARRHLRIDVVNAYDDGIVMPFGPVPVVHRADLEKSSQMLLETTVARALDGADARDVPVELIPAPHRPARALLDVADGADLLVVGSRGHGTFAGSLLGSVSQQCVHHAPCPVVVVPSPVATPAP
jgi:nucleotide-binding universal stress UspA family protein